MARRFGRRFGSSGSFHSAGGVYKTGGSTYEVRRHALSTTVTVPQGKARVIPLLVYSASEGKSVNVSSLDTKIASAGTKVYPTLAVQEGSRVSNIHVDITIEPETQNSSNIINFYTGRITTSFHDLNGGQIMGLSGDSSGTVQMVDEDNDSDANAVDSNGLCTHDAGTDITLTNKQYEEGDVIKHWWRGKRKNVMFGGQPIVYDRWEKVPMKCKRSNKGMFYGMWVINDATAISGSQVDDLRIRINTTFNEVPLIQ